MISLGLYASILSEVVIFLSNDISIQLDDSAMALRRILKTTSMRLLKLSYIEFLRVGPFTEACMRNGYVMLGEV